MNTLKTFSLGVIAAAITTSMPMIAAGKSTTAPLPLPPSNNNFTIPWEVITETAFPPVTSLKTNSSLIFEFEGEIHNVYQFPDKEAYNDCDFSNATEISDSGPVSVNVTEGITYFGCSVGNHCTRHGMSVAVIVD